MHALGYFIIAIAKIIGLILNLYIFLLIAAALISWVNPDPYNPIVRLLKQLTEPVLWRIRKILPQSFFKSGFDFTPLIVLIIITIINDVLVRLLLDWGQGFLSKS